VGHGDFNDDGISDIVSSTGSPYWGDVVYIYLGGEDFNGVPDARMTDYSVLWNFGATTATGDLNGDGRDELAVAAPAYFNRGRVYLYEGPQTWVDYGAQAVPPEELVRHPGWFVLGQNYPNPCNAATTIPFTIGKPSVVSLSLYDLHGNLVVELVPPQEMAPGGYTVAWAGRNRQGHSVASGLYLLEMRVDQYRQNKKVILMK
jgi:hypothetical protein